MKRIVSTALCVTMLLFSFTYAENHMDFSLIKKARETTSVMHELACMDGLTGMYTSNADILSSIHEIATYDYNTPESAVVVTVSEDCVAGILAEMGIDAPEGSDLFRAMKGKLYNTIPSMLNAQSSTSWLGLTSVLSVSDAYTPDEPYSGIAFVLLRYAGEQPDMVCAFNMNGTAAVVTASYLEASVLDGVDWSAGAIAILEGLLDMEISIDPSGIIVTEYPAEAIQ